MLLLGEIWFTVVKMDVHLGETCMYEYGFGNAWKLNIIECYEMCVCAILIWDELWMEDGSCLVIKNGYGF